MFLVNKVVQLKCEQEGCDGDEAIIETKLGQLPRFFVLSLKRFRPTEDGEHASLEKFLSPPVPNSHELDFVPYACIRDCIRKAVEQGGSE